MSGSARLKVEHIALNVEDPVAMAAWYVSNLGMRIVREGPPPVNARFLADATGRLMFEIYANGDAPIPDYGSQDPLTFHIAFETDDVEAVCARLTAAGATVVDGPLTSPTGDGLLMLRDPAGIAIQFVTRAEPMT